MVGKKITYTDFTGNEITEVFYFNLTQAELAEMNLSIDGGFDQLSNRFKQKPDASQMVDIFKALIHKAVCEKTADGKRYVKSEDIANAFIMSDAYSQLFIEMIMSDNSDNVIDFLSKVITRKPGEGNAINTAEVKAQAEAEARDATKLLESQVEVIE